jgi:hypothetical protein
MRHEYVPDRRVNHDECSVCGEDFEARVHPDIDQHIVSRRLPRNECKRGHVGRYSGGRCLECLHVTVVARRALTGGSTLPG